METAETMITGMCFDIVIGFHFPVQFEPAFLGHHHIQEDQVGLVLFNHLETFFPILGHHRFIPAGLYQGGDENANIHLIVHH